MASGNVQCREKIYIYVDERMMMSESHIDEMNTCQRKEIKRKKQQQQKKKTYRQEIVYERAYEESTR